MRNFGYFLREVKTTIQLNKLSNTFSLISTVLIFFILATVLSGWFISSHIVRLIQGESEISVYYNEKIDGLNLAEKINIIEYINDAKIVQKEEALERMEKILGPEAKILSLFEENPFNAFIEIKININDIDYAIEEIQQFEGVEYIRDNREILDRIGNLSKVFRYAGLLVLLAVGVSTLVIVSYIIRQSIHHNAEHIETLRLLGAPETFIAIPFILVGLLLTLSGGVIASIMTAVTLKYIFTYMISSIPFIPMPSYMDVVSNSIVIIIPISILLGLLGSFMGLSSKSN